MRTTTHGDFLIQLTHFPVLGPICCYLVREDDGLTLIDAALTRSAPHIIAATERLGMPIQRIALTHNHNDHTGALRHVRERFPNAVIAIGASEDITGLQLEEARRLRHGDRVGSLEVIDSPGHTPGHISFIDARDRSLIAGDAFVTRGGVAVAGAMRLLMPFPHMFTQDRPTALASARRLRDYEPARLAVGHGHVVESPLSAIDRAIDHAERKLARARS